MGRVWSRKKRRFSKRPKEDEFFADGMAPIPNTQVEAEKNRIRGRFFRARTTDIADNASIDSLARKVAQTNSLVDSALGGIGR